MPNNPAKIGTYRCGEGEPLLLIAGPCVLEELVLPIIAEKLSEIARRFPVHVVFKGSFDKANRTSLASPRGPGLKRGLEWLAEIRKTYRFPVTTDIHESYQAESVGEVCDLVQIPAFLARQTDLLVAAAKTGKAVHVKKGQFMAPGDMRHVVGKLEGAGCSNILLGERGTFFGYQRLVNDMCGLVEMRKLGTPVVFDATHSVQKPGGLENATGGNREMIFPLARAAIAVGIDALFVETHPTPETSPSDGPNMLPLDQWDTFLEQILAIRHAVTNC
ncbi:MAG: 3-deoxy-8-phosphooctulonate synthase [Planctomycetaceae bacterium]|jgi:2-dehydro-3-deoxyphosphooctonate aldolase (KDO 8-P synthase)|nr:3-deoxy-8-phosphooctulonate synthase [Planctomycetaceae bacterium]